METPPSVPETTPPDSVEPAMSLGARLLNVFAAPGEVFDSIKNAPVSAANWLVPVLILCLAGWMGTALIFSNPALRNQASQMATAAIDKQVESGQLTPEKAESARATAEKMGHIGGIVGGALMPVFAGFGTAFIGGLIVWLVGSKALGGGFAYMKGVEIASLACMIAVLGEIVRVLLVMTTGSLAASPSLALLMQDVNPQDPMFGLLSVFNLFLFWELGVRALGTAKVSGASFGKAALWIFGIWAAITGTFVGIGFAVSKAFGQ